MWYQFLLENSHFAASLFAAMVMFAVSWLYFDAWLERKNFIGALRITGFLCLSISFLVHATFIETALLSTSILGSEVNSLLTLVMRVLGYGLIATSLYFDQLQEKPVTSGVTNAVLGFSLKLVFLQPFLAVTVGFLYLRRAIRGLEHHLKMPGFAFLVLFLFEIVSLSKLWEGTDNVDIYDLVAPFAPLWIIQHIILIVGIFILGKWVWQYLLKRLLSQLFMIFIASILVIFLVTTVSFTFLILKNLQDESLRQLTADVKVLNFAIESKKAETLADAELVAQNPQVISQVLENKRSELADFTKEFLLAKKYSTVFIVNKVGQVLARGDDPERIGDSLSDDRLIKRVLAGENLSSIITKDGVLAPDVSIRSAAVMKKDGELAGAVVTAVIIDNAFVDGVKKATGLEASIYGGNQLSATTLAVGGESRANGVKLDSEEIRKKVLLDGQGFSGPVNILNVSYIAAIEPMQDMDNNPVGMLFMGREQVGVLAAAGKSIELTFLVAVILLVIIIMPTYFVSKYISSQLH